MADQRARRRLAAIAVADVVGYSRLMEADEAGTLAAMKERRKAILDPVVRGHEGRVIKTMGDGVLLEFASAVNAVAAAVELQEKMAEANAGLGEDRCILLRIGINLGALIGEGSDIYGDLRQHRRPAAGARRSGRDLGLGKGARRDPRETRARVRRHGRAAAEAGGVLGICGRSEEGIEVLRRAIRLDPYVNFAWYSLATCLYLVGRNDEAWRRSGKPRAAGPYGRWRVKQPAWRSSGGSMKRALAAEVLRRNPDFSVRAELPHYKYPADAERWRQGLLKAGLPD